MSYIDELKEAIRSLHGCEADHVETVPVLERFHGRPIWQGEVEVFNLRGHPKAKRAYAWSHASGENDQKTRYVAVLELPPVDSANSAVKVAIVEEAKRKS
jgi:hypothetical protein